MTPFRRIWHRLFPEKRAVQRPLPSGTQIRARADRLGFMPAKADLLIAARIGKVEQELGVQERNLASVASNFPFVERTRRRVAAFRDVPDGPLARAVILWPAASRGHEHAITSTTQFGEELVAEAIRCTDTLGLLQRASRIDTELRERFGAGMASLVDELLGPVEGFHELTQWPSYNDAAHQLSKVESAREVLIEEESRLLRSLDSLAAHGWVHKTDDEQSSELTSQVGQARQIVLRMASERRQEAAAVFPSVERGKTAAQKRSR